MNYYYAYYIATEQRVVILPTKMVSKDYFELMNSNNLQSVKTFLIGFIMGCGHGKNGLIVKNKIEEFVDNVNYVNG